jgi:hypothetical protein
MILSILGSWVWAFADEPEIEKTWRFQGKTSAVEIKLTRYVQEGGKKATSLAIYSTDGGQRSVPEEGEFLSKVLGDLPDMGISPQSLDWISFQFYEPEAIRKVAAYAASSKQWRAALETRSAATIYPLVTSFLNDSGAYQDWNSVFASHGLKLKVAGVEKVGMESFSKSGANCPVDANCDHLLVPSSASVQMNVEPVDRR